LALWRTANYQNRTGEVEQRAATARENSMVDQPYRRAVVTGASSGIGAAVVERLCAAGLEVYAVARDAARLEALAQKTGCIPTVLSVTDQAGVAAFFAEHEIDILVNNAGQSRKGNLADTTAQDIDALVDVNLRAVLQITFEAIKGMKARNCGHIVNISSIAGHYAFPGGNTVYHATKAGVHSMSAQLRCDLYGTKLRVTEISPARVETEVFGRLLGDMEEAYKRCYAEYESLLPADLADAIAFAVFAPQRMNVSFMEVLPTMQVVGGLAFAKSREG